MGTVQTAPRLAGVWKIVPMPWLVPKNDERQELTNCDHSTRDKDP
jgi:hypothetical protein